MRKRNILALAVGALAGAPAFLNAATLTFTWEVSTDGGATYNPIVGNTLAITKGTEDYLGLLASTGTTNVNPAGTASGGPYSTGTHVQPAYLGTTSFGFGFTNSNGSFSSLDPTNTDIAGTDNASNGNTDLAGTALPGPYSGTGGKGVADGLGGIGLGTSDISGSFLAASATVSKTTPAQNSVGYASNTAQEVFRDLGIVGGSASGSSTITPVGQGFNITTNTNVGTATTPPTYGQTNSGFNTVLPTLTVTNVAGTVGATHQPIISLVPLTAPLTTYGVVDGAIVVTGAGRGSYVPTAATGFVTATTGFVAVSGFNPSTDTEIYALKLSSNGTTLTAAQVQTVIGDINGTNGTTNGSQGVVASTITAPYSTLFPASAGYNLLLTATGVANPAELGFDFSSVAEQDTAVPNITVTGIAAVPEPATAASVVLGAAGLMLGRRRKQSATV